MDGSAVVLFKLSEQLHQLIFRIAGRRIQHVKKACQTKPICVRISIGMPRERLGSAGGFKMMVEDRAGLRRMRWRPSLGCALCTPARLFE